ncbi:unnamed protein product [Ophioblennius macclurei]
MWSAFMNGSGLHGGGGGGGGGGAGGGYVPSQGWEFVPCSRMERADRGRGKSRSPLRRISSPPTVFSQIYEPPFGPPPGGEGGGPTPLDILRGQMWPGPEAQQQPQQQQQTQHSRLRKKFEDLKKRHVQDKEEWLREKETLLREVADIQGGENRRILLDLKTVLEEVQAEVKREEEKRSELQLQYTRDRCAWELEKAELKSRIAQLEAKDTVGSASGEAQAPGGPGVAASGSPRQQYGQTTTTTTTLRREREEQRRILVDTQTAAMDLRCRLEHNERDWLKEKTELLERFDVERREWENQLKDMQKKIEELYCEVRVKRGGTVLDSGRQDDDDDVTNRLSTRSISTGSSLLSDTSRSEPLLRSCSPSEPNIHQSLFGLGHKSNVSGDGSKGGHHPACFKVESLCEFGAGSPFSDHSQAEHEDDLRSRDPWQKDSAADTVEVVDTAALEALFCGTPGCGASPDSDANTSVHVTPQESSLWTTLSYSSDKKKNTTALNAALKEIARVSEELCSYQDEIRKKSGDKRSRSESVCLPEDDEITCGDDKSGAEEDEASCDLNQIYIDFRALERENWISLSPDNTWQVDRELRESCTTTTTDLDSNRSLRMIFSGADYEMDTAAPPIPPRTSSRNLSAPGHPDTELHIPDSPMATVRKCHSPCILMDRKCSSPSVVRKFEAMLQENEGKVFVDGVLASCAVPINSNCNMGCCHNRWSCDVSKFSNSKLSAYATVQKSLSEVNIRSAGKDLLSDYSLKNPELPMPLLVGDLPVDLLLSSLEKVPVSSDLKGSKRNIMLEQKTAEFNKTLFQAEMGHGVEEQSSFTPIDTCSVGHQPLFTPSDEDSAPKVMKSPPLCTDVPTRVTDAHREETLSLFVSESTTPNPEDQPKPKRCGSENQAVRLKQETPSVVSPEQLQAALSEAATSSRRAIQRCEVKHKVQTASSPSRKPQHRAATEAPFSECAVPANTQLGQPRDDSSLKNENPHGAKPQPAKAGVSLQQLSAENKQKQMTQPRHVSAPSLQPDSSRPGPRMMNDHPWKPLTLAAYPRPEGSRSNYGALERILKNYENAARAQQSQSQESVSPSSPNFSLRQEEDVTELDRLPMGAVRQTQTSHFTETHTSISSHSAVDVKEIQLIAQGREDNRWNT